MQRIVSSATVRSLTARSFARPLGRATRGVSVPAATLTSRRLSSSHVPPSVRPPTAAGTEEAKAAETTSIPQLDAKAAEQVRLAHDIGEQAFGENTEILKQVGYRGLRAFVVCAVGMGAFMWAMKKKKAELAAGEEKGGSGAASVAANDDDDDDPTQRYLEEMRSLGFDVDTLEEELEQERVAKLAAAKTGNSAS